ncbi:MAG: PPC domain-containing DNA-binding protein [Thermomicrobiales bacterium]
MQSTQLYDDNGLRTWLLVMDDGDEAFAEIIRFASVHNLNAASLTAIGACRSATLAYFDAGLGGYIDQRFDEQLEIAAFIGDIASDDGEPALHAHVVLGRRDFSTLAGHVNALEVFPTMEVVITESPAHLRKRLDKANGLTLISSSSSTPAETS